MHEIMVIPECGNAKWCMCALQSHVYVGTVVALWVTMPQVLQSWHIASVLGVPAPWDIRRRH